MTIANHLRDTIAGARMLRDKTHDKSTARDCDLVMQYAHDLRARLMTAAPDNKPDARRDVWTWAGVRYYDARMDTAECAAKRRAITVVCDVVFATFA